MRVNAFIQVYPSVDWDSTYLLSGRRSLKHDVQGEVLGLDTPQVGTWVAVGWAGGGGQTGRRLDRKRRWLGWADAGVNNSAGRFLAESRWVRSVAGRPCLAVVTASRSRPYVRAISRSWAEGIFWLALGTHFRTPSIKEGRCSRPAASVPAVVSP